MRGRAARRFSARKGGQVTRARSLCDFGGSGAREATSAP